MGERVAMCCRRCGAELGLVDGPTLLCGKSLYRRPVTIECLDCGRTIVFTPHGRARKSAGPSEPALAVVG